MAEKKSFMLYIDTAEQWNMLTDEQAGSLIKAIFRFVLTGERLKTDDGMLQMAFSFMSAQIDRDADKYEQICVKRKEAVEKRWKQKRTNDTNVCESIQAGTNDTDKDKETDKETDKDKETETDKETDKDTVGLSDTQRNILNAEYGNDVVRQYEAKIADWERRTGKRVSDYDELIRKWLSEDGVPRFDFDKYSFVINKI